jgi:integrase
MKLTQPNVATLRLPSGKADAIFFDDDLPGFGLRLRAGGKKTWIIQYRVGAKQRRHAFGTTATLRADKARDEAARRLARVRLGGDPQQEKIENRAVAALTVGRLVEDYLARRHYQTGKDPLRKSSYEATELYLQKQWKPLHGLQANKVSRSDVARRLGAIETDISSVTAARARVSLSTMFAWAIGQGIVENNPVIGTNKPPEPEARTSVLSDAELVDIWAACRDDNFGRIVRLLVLTAQRRDEIADLQWNEIDFDRAAIDLPAERTKNHRPHSVPLSPMALAILKSAPRRHRQDGTPLPLFGEGKGGFSGWSKAKAALDRRILDARAKVAGTSADPVRPVPDWRLHDLRRTAATVMADRLGVLPHVIEAVLNHISGHRAGVAGIYNRASYERETRAALSLWAQYVGAIVTGEAATVVPLRRSAP